MTDIIENAGQPENTAPAAGEKKPENTPKKEKQPMTFKRLYKEWILPFGLEILALFLIVKFVFFVPIVPTGSMEPTGLPGDHVEIDENGTVTINGEVQQESYVVYQYAIPSEFDVPEGYYLFMGDNRANSMDSRYWQNPYVSGESIQGRAIFTLFPFSNFGNLQ